MPNCTSDQPDTSQNNEARRGLRSEDAMPKTVPSYWSGELPQQPNRSDGKLTCSQLNMADQNLFPVPVTPRLGRAARRDQRLAFERRKAMRSMAGSVTEDVEPDADNRATSADSCHEVPQASTAGTTRETSLDIVPSPIGAQHPRHWDKVYTKLFEKRKEAQMKATLRGYDKWTCWSCKNPVGGYPFGASLESQHRWMRSRAHDQVMYDFGDFATLVCNAPKCRDARLEFMESHECRLVTCENPKGCRSDFPVYFPDISNSAFQVGVKGDPQSTAFLCSEPCAAETLLERTSSGRDDNHSKTVRRLGRSYHSQEVTGTIEVSNAPGPSRSGSRRASGNAGSSWTPINR
ncbi:hypothetical protein I302_108006 [Kwoniella bestiolae CBS 10118]|uniref:Uncharacterized protein n=1 Tax=Kwoniella bestiolae CBS 10118 TaxID=1296100 RepID=A0A1B9FWX2_9TREE|nr:hypothetical protein I302_07629 [Kwoniella bestiolae CBS 10118]OCF23275.1 hypothetical protein I302_07629 [Kwoniella bestiolae CBS 10118]